MKTLLVLLMALYSHSFTTGNGLPDNNVRVLATDSKGFLWLGTPNGLFRFDGYSSTTMHMDEQTRTMRIYKAHINRLMALPDEKMLIRQPGNLYSLYDVRREQFVSLEYNGQKPAFRHYAYRDSALWLWDEGGAAIRYRLDTLPVTYTLLSCRDVPLYDTQTPGEQRAAEWLASGRMTNIIHDNLDNPCVLDKLGNLIWIDRESGREVQLKVFTEAMSALVDSRKYCVRTSPNRRYTWVSTNGCGITLYDHQTGETQSVRSSSGLIANDFVLDMDIDNDGNILVALDDYGVTGIAVPDHRFICVRPVPESQLLRDNRVSHIRPLSDGSCFVANQMGGNFRLMSDLTIHPLPAYRNIDVHCVAENAEGQLWLGTRQRGLRTPDGEWLSHDDNDSASLAGNNLSDLFIDEDGDCWAALYYESLDCILTRPSSVPTVLHALPQQWGFRLLMQDHAGRVWAGTKHGLIRFIPRELKKDTSAYERVLSEQDLHYSEISDLCEAADGTLWIATLGEGVFTLRSDGRIGLHLRSADGLVSDEIRSLVIADDGEVWMATPRGLTCYQPESGRWRHIYDESHLPRNIYQDHTGFRLPDGRLVFGTDDGVVCFRPGEESTPSPTRLCLTGTRVNNEPIALCEGETLRLSHDHNTLSFRFSTFNYRSPNSTLYSFYLEGYDQTWSGLSSYNEVHYRELHPGDYVLHVRAYNANMPYGEYTLPIHIDNPWWATVWAILFYLLAGSSLLYVFLRQVNQIYGLRQRLKVERELSEYKALFFTNISHEFRTPLTIIRSSIDQIASMENIPNDMRNPIRSLSRSTERMLRLINQFLDFRMAESGRLILKTEQTDVVAFIRDIYHNFWPLADQKIIDYRFSMSQHKAVGYVDRLHLDKMAYNLISNAIKYTPEGGHVLVRVQIEEQTLIFRVEDDGIGIAEENRQNIFDEYMHTTFRSSNSMGIGLHFTRQLAECHHGTIHYEPNQPSGCIFEIRIPIAEEAYSAEEKNTAEEQRREAILAEPEQNALPEARSGSTAAPLNDRTVLIVDDDDELARYMESLLSPYFHILTASDGVNAIARVENTHVDLIISDIMMSPIDGYELTQRLRQGEKTRSLPVILLSSMTANNKRVRAMRLGADAYLTKPFDTGLLISTCQNLLQRHDQLRQSYAGEVVERKEQLPEVIVEERDKKFLQSLNHLILTHLEDSQLSVDFLAERLAIGRTVFFKRVKALTGETPADYIRIMRLRRAAELLRDGELTVSEVSYRVGIEDPHYFIRLFKNQYEITPKKYQQGQKNTQE